MDPRFQTYNSSPYPQNPNSLPQYHPYQSPETQSSPNKYPSLPPIQNPQHHQPYPQTSQNQTGYPGYVPPAQYGNAQAELKKVESHEKTEFERQLESIDQDLETGYMKCYITLNYLICVGCGLGAYNLVDAFMSSKNLSDRNLFLVLIFTAVWLTLQAYFAISAYGQKNVTKATVAFWMMMIFLVPLIFIEMFFSALLENESAKASKNGVLVAKIFLVLNSILLFVHVFVNLVGAFKVRRMLVERTRIEMKFDHHHPLDRG